MRHGVQVPGGETLEAERVQQRGVLAAVCYRWDKEELRRQCPGCGRVLKLHDTVCMACGEELSRAQPEPTGMHHFTIDKICYHRPLNCREG